MGRPLSSFRPVKPSKRKSDGGTLLPLYHQKDGGRSRKAVSGRSCIHIIPLIVLLCFFILWWFSYPVNLEVKDGRVTMVSYSDIEMPKFLNETRVDFAFLAAIGTPPYTSISHIQAVDNESTAEPVNGTD